MLLERDFDSELVSWGSAILVCTINCFIKEIIVINKISPQLKHSKLFFDLNTGEK